MTSLTISITELSYILVTNKRPSVIFLTLWRHISHKNSLLDVSEVGDFSVPTALIQHLQEVPTMMINICSICRIRYYDTYLYWHIFKEFCVAEALNITIAFAHSLTHNKQWFYKMRIQWSPFVWTAKILLYSFEWPLNEVYTSHQVHNIILLYLWHFSPFLGNDLPNHPQTSLPSCHK